MGVRQKETTNSASVGQKHRVGSSEPLDFQKGAQRAGPVQTIHLTFFRDLRSRLGSSGVKDRE